MNRIISLTILFCSLAAHGLRAGEKLKQMTKAPEQPADVRKEVLAYYTHLTETDDDVKKQVAQLTARSKEKAGGLFKRWDEPRAIEWLPRAERRSNNEGDAEHGHYLVVQLAGRWRTKDADADMALVSEFDVIYDERDGKLTITFLGFRKLAMTPVASGK